MLASNRVAALDTQAIGTRLCACRCVRLENRSGFDKHRADAVGEMINHLSRHSCAPIGRASFFVWATRSPELMSAPVIGTHFMTKTSTPQHNRERTKTRLYGDETRRMGIVGGPPFREFLEVLLRDVVRGFLLSAVEAVQDDSDEEVQEHESDREREATGSGCVMAGCGCTGRRGRREEGGWATEQQRWQ